jgi:hypothetical protein
MTCTHCGNYVAEGSAVCPTCGTQMAGTGSAQGAPTWASASGPTDDRMDPSTPSWSQGSQPTNPHWSVGGGQPGNAPGQPWSPGGQQASPPGPPPGPSWSPAGGQPGNAPGQPWSPGGQQASPPGPPGPSWSPAGGQPANNPGPSWNQAPNAPGPSWGQPGGQPVQGQGSSAFNFDARRWTLPDRIAGIASLVVLISLFLPWFSATASVGTFSESATASGTTAHGWLWLVFIISLAIVVYLVLMAGFQVLPFKLPVPTERLLLGATGVNLVLVFLGFILVPSNGGDSEVSIGWAFGAFVALLAAIVALGALTPIGRQKLNSGAS